MRRGLLIVSATAIVGLAGCGSSAGGGQQDHQGSSPAAQAVRAAYETTTGAKSATVTLDQFTTIQNRTAGFSGNGTINFKSRQLKLTVANPKGTKLQLRRKNDVVYMKYPETAADRLPPGKSWVRLDLGDGAAGKSRKARMYISGAVAMDPTRSLTYLQDVSEVTKVGTAEIGGTRTTHYRVKVNLDQAATRMGEAGKRSVRQMKQRLGSSTLPLELWLDDQGRVRKQVTSVDYKTPAGKQATSKTTVKLAHFGAGAPVTTPPKDKVTDMASVKKASHQQ